MSIEEDVTKLKASIGSGIDVINALLHVEGLERGEIMQNEVERVARQSKQMIHAVNNVADAFQSGIATRKQANDLRDGLEDLTNSLRPMATTQRAQSLITADLSSQIENAATKGQADDLVKLIEGVNEEQNNGHVALLSLSRSSRDELSELCKIT